MTSGERNTQFREGVAFRHGLAAGVKINKGALAILVNGFLKPGAAVAGSVTVGIATESVSNVDGADNDASVSVKTGTVLLKNATLLDELMRTDIGKECYVLDDETVAKTDGGSTRAVAGRVRAVEQEGVWVTI